MRETGRANDSIFRWGEITDLVVVFFLVYRFTDPLRQSQNPLGTRSEINHTINWVRSHLEVDPSVSIPKQDVYEDYV
jgi:hypothetical protein